MDTTPQMISLTVWITPSLGWKVAFQRYSWQDRCVAWGNGRSPLHICLTLAMDSYHLTIDLPLKKMLCNPFCHVFANFLTQVIWTLVIGGIPAWERLLYNLRRIIHKPKNQKMSPTRKTHSDSIAKWLSISHLKAWLVTCNHLQTQNTIQFQNFDQITIRCSKIKDLMLSQGDIPSIPSPSAWLICSSSLPQPLGGGSAMEAPQKWLSDGGKLHCSGAGDPRGWVSTDLQQRQAGWASSAVGVQGVQGVQDGTQQAVSGTFMISCQSLIRSWFSWCAQECVLTKVTLPWLVLYLPWLSKHLLFLSLNFSSYTIFHSEHTHVAGPSHRKDLLDLLHSIK